MSNIELLKIELKKRKQGNIQLTINALAFEFNRNKQSLIANFRILGEAKYIKVTTGFWEYVE